MELFWLLDYSNVKNNNWADIHEQMFIFTDNDKSNIQNTLIYAYGTTELIKPSIIEKFIEVV